MYPGKPSGTNDYPPLETQRLDSARSDYRRLSPDSSIVPRPFKLTLHVSENGKLRVLYVIKDADMCIMATKKLCTACMVLLSGLH